MNNNFNVTIPNSLREIKLGAWQRYVQIYEKNKDSDNLDFLNLKMLQLFCGFSLQESRKVPISDFDAILTHLGDLFKEKTPRVNQFTLIGTDGVEVTFGLIPNLDKMSYGEWVDLEEYIFDNQTLHRAMAVLYRPLIMGKGKDRYLIHEYKGTDEMADVMKEMPIDIALGARVFFYRLAKKLGKSILDSTLQSLMTQEAANLEARLEKSGKAIKQSLS